MLGAWDKAEEIRQSIPGAVTLEQFKNQANPQAHYETTGREIYEDLNGQIDYLVAGAGSGGTYSGVVKFLKEKNSLQGIQGFVNGDLAEPWVAQDDYTRTEWVVSKDAPLGDGNWARFLTADYQELEPLRAHLQSRSLSSTIQR